MLEEFAVENFKTWISGVFRPQSLNLLIGRNNSGKSNLCQAIRFLSASASHPLDTCADMVLRQRTGISSWSLRKSRVKFAVRATISRTDGLLTFVYELAFRAPVSQTLNPRIEVDTERLTVSSTNLGIDELVLLDRNAVGVRLLDETATERDRVFKYVEMAAPRDVTTLHSL